MATNNSVNVSIRILQASRAHCLQLLYTIRLAVIVMVWCLRLLVVAKKALEEQFLTSTRVPGVIHTPPKYTLFVPKNI